MCKKYFSEYGGSYFIGDCVELLHSDKFQHLKGSVQLILTSPPFPLTTKKNYGNLNGDTYLQWFTSLAPLFSSLLTPDGSIVIEMGNCWEKGRPVQSLLHLDSLLGFIRHPSAGLQLIQQFICYNPSRLPTPVAWVNINRIRTVDSYTHVWWLACTDYPKADNRKVTRPYSNSMKKLLKSKKYNPGKRPSEHIIGQKSFLTDHGGAIAHNFFEMEALDPNREIRLPNAFSFANTVSSDHFNVACKNENIVPHPARMPSGLASFFIQFLTDQNDLIFDPFAGSNTTGFMAALHGRRWLSFEINSKYYKQARLRFTDPAFFGKEHP